MSLVTSTSNDPVVAVADVSHRFGAVLALQSVSLSLPRGQVLALLGHNGAGKTTLVNILATLIARGSPATTCGLSRSTYGAGSV